MSVNMDERVKRRVNQIKEHLAKIYGEKIRRVILYGSCARGQATTDSDIDVLLLVDESLDPFEVRENLSDILFDMVLDEGDMVSVMAVPENFFETYNSPFMLNVKKEGVTA